MLLTKGLTTVTETSSAVSFLGDALKKSKNNTSLQNITYANKRSLEDFKPLCLKILNFLK